MDLRTNTILLNGSSAYAYVPNVWQKWFASQGILVYIIENENVKLDLECNGGGQIDSDGNYQDHYLNIMVNKKELKLDSKNSLEFLIDGEIAAFSFQDRANFVSTNWRKGANSWNEFIELLSTAKNISKILLHQ